MAKDNQTGTTMNPSALKPQTQNGFLRRAAIVLLAAVCVFGVVLACVSARNETLRRKVSFSYSGNLQQLCLFDFDRDDEAIRDRIRQTRRHGQTHAFTYFCTDAMHFDAITPTAPILFGNPNEDCVLVLTILNANDDVLYRSGGVPGGKYITQIELPLLEEGTYECRAYVTAYRNADKSLVGVQYSPLTIEMGGQP